ncbi:MAG: DUF481 domain-containing protein [Gemmatimonadales bacterium]|nr:DUF481 domain-containing protein [Gemmatimonadales bacterium]NIN13279.1 DUF481 domain-containing protein [Gemmatimonadales bacterium]NIQ99740.1 DUF481 domain-containing protein [Gemmatimonadales bacterium]NIS64237.1 DUF481 domain-containing protein [Gemmatimonadales bacterium]
MARGTALSWLPVLVAVVVSPLSAQVNIERLRAGEEQKRLSGSLGFNLAARTGNVELVQFGLDGRLDHVSELVTTFLMGSGDLGWKGGDRFINEGMLHLRQVYRRGSSLRPEVFAQVNYNESRLLDFRALVGGGIRVRLFRNPTARFWWGSAYMFEYERLDLLPDAIHAQRTSVHRWSNYLSSRIRFNERATLLWIVYVQPQLDEIKDLRILSDTSLGAELAGPTSLLVSLRMHYDSRPPDGKESLDTTIRTGVTIEF